MTLSGLFLLKVYLMEQKAISESQMDQTICLLMQNKSALGEYIISVTKKYLIMCLPKILCSDFKEKSLIRSRVNLLD